MGRGEVHRGTEATAGRRGIEEGDNERGGRGKKKQEASE